MTKMRSPHDTALCTGKTANTTIAALTIKNVIMNAVAREHIYLAEDATASTVSIEESSISILKAPSSGSRARTGDGVPSGRNIIKEL